MGNRRPSRRGLAVVAVLGLVLVVATWGTKELLDEPQRRARPGPGGPLPEGRPAVEEQPVAEQDGEDDEREDRLPEGSRSRRPEGIVIEGIQEVTITQAERRRRTRQAVEEFLLEAERDEPAPPSATQPDGDPQPSEPTGVFAGQVLFAGARPLPLDINVSSDPFCSGALGSPLAFETARGQGDALGDVFVWVMAGPSENPLPPADTLEFQRVRRDGLVHALFEEAAEFLPSPPVVAEDETAFLRYERCEMVPRVLALTAGQRLRVVNEDGTLHNLHTRPKLNVESNVALPAQGTSIDRLFPTPELAIPVTCDVHPWEGAWLAVTAHDLHVVTELDGSWELPGTHAPGHYRIGFWHPTFGERTEDLLLARGQRTELAVVYMDE